MTKPNLQTSRRAFLSGLTAASLSACGNTRQPGLSTLVKTVSDAFRDKSYGTEDVERIPYASIGVRPGEGTEVLVVLASAENSRDMWIAGDHSVITTQHGRIMRLIALGSDVEVQSGWGPDPVTGGTLTALTPNSVSPNIIRLVDFSKEQLYSVTCTAQITALGPATIDLLYGPVEALHYVEKGVAPSLEWPFENHFFIHEKTGLMLQSSQQVSPWLPDIHIRVLRPQVPL